MQKFLFPVLLPPIGRIWYRNSAANNTSKQVKPLQKQKLPTEAMLGLLPWAIYFVLGIPICGHKLLTHMVWKVLKSQSFSDFAAGRCCFVLPYPLESITLWVSVWVRWLTHVFSPTFPGKKINASQHPYRMPSGIDGLFPGLKKCPLDTFLRKFCNFRRPLRVSFP